MSTNIIIQARLGSTRLPGKVLRKINGIPVIELIYKRLKKCKLVDQIIVATSTNKDNDDLVNFLKLKKIKYFRGNEKDVLSRFFHAAKKFKFKTVIRITADCPLVDPT